MSHRKLYPLLSPPFGQDIHLGQPKILFAVIGPQLATEVWQQHLETLLKALGKPALKNQGWTLVLAPAQAECIGEDFENWLHELSKTHLLDLELVVLPELPMIQAQSTWSYWLDRCDKYLSLASDPAQDYFVIRALEATKPVLSFGPSSHSFIFSLLPDATALSEGLLKWEPQPTEQSLLQELLGTYTPPFEQMLTDFVEPQQADFDAYFYDINGKPLKDFDLLPPFLHKEIQEVRYGSGTNKFLWLIYQFASQARLAIECGVFAGGTSVPLAKGLQQQHGSLISIDIDLSQSLLHERIVKHQLYNTEYLLGSDLEFKRPDLYALADIIYIDTFHQYEETLKELFLYDLYLKPGGIVLMHDLIATFGVGLVDSSEDYGYTNSMAIKAFLGERHEVRQITDHPMYLLAPKHQLAPVLLAIETFLAYRPNYRFYKILDQAGMGILLKQSKPDKHASTNE